MKMNKYRSLDELQKEVRIAIMDMIIEEGRPVNLGEVRIWVSKNLNLDDEYINKTLEIFIERNIMVVDEDNNINFIYPVSAIHTMHKVTLDDGREFNSMCAIDALGCRCTFNQNLSIRSMCCVTGKEVELKIEDNKVSYVNNEDLRILHLNLDKFENWAASCWNIMNFFWTKNEFDVWSKNNGYDNDKDIYCLDLDEAMKASYEIFSTHILENAM